jgi:GT2 family glycosyltransferase
MTNMSIANSLELSIIIVNYNGEKYLADCLESVRKQCQGITYEIIIVDNQSTDNSLEIIEDYYPESILIRNITNEGFAKANNIGVKKSKGKFILLLNNDTVLLDNLRPAVNMLSENAVGAVGIKMLDSKKKYRKSIGYFPNPLSLFKLSLLTKNRNGFSTGDFNETTYEVDWIEASFLLTKRSLWDQVGGLCEDYFMYVEDVDFSKRLSRIKKKRIYFNKISYIHYGGFNPTREKLLIDGYFTYINNFHKNPTKAVYKICLTLNKFIKILKNKF